MKLYENGNIEVDLMEESDRDTVINLFKSNRFVWDYEANALRPTVDELNNIIDGIIYNNDDENKILILHYNKESIGYASLFVEYNRLHIGHMAIKEKYQGKGFSKDLINAIKDVAENENRNLVTTCFYGKSNCFYRNGFDTADGLHYYYRIKGKKVGQKEKLFVSAEEYQKRMDEKAQKSLHSFKMFLKTIGKHIHNI